MSDQSCPKCGDRTGYKYTRWEKFIVFEDWDGSSESMDADPTGQIKLEGYATCVECGGTFVISKIRK